MPVKQQRSRSMKKEYSVNVGNSAKNTLTRDDLKKSENLQEQ